MALPLFAVTLFISAFLLFLVQPMIGKMILPKLGGTPQVWNTCMVFFQSALLAGYAYTHAVSARLKPRTQLLMHGALLVVPILFMLPVPFWYVEQWTPPAGGINPIWSTLGLLAFVVGIPFLVVSTSAPLLQRWFVYTGDKAAKDPYFLYAASNLGSLLSLLAYPFIIEPILPVIAQRYTFLVGYIILCVLILACAATLWKMPTLDLAGVGGSEPEAPEPTPAIVPEAQASTALKSGPAPAPMRGGQRKKGVRIPARTGPAVGLDPIEAPQRPYEMTWWRRFRWVMLAAVPSSLMLGVTSYISVDLSPFPLLWVIPLALYLLAFILVFMPWWTTPSTSQRGGGSTFTPHSLVMFILMPLGILGLAAVLLRGGFDPLVSTGALIFCFFFVALGCHGELAKDRPPTRYLTEYYLMMSVGGMLGGVFNGIFAPLVFPGVWEFPIAIVIAAFTRPQLAEHGWTDNFLLDSSPGFQAWTRDQGDAVAQATGRPAPGSTWLFGFIMDVLLACFVFALAWAVKSYSTNILQFLGFRGGQRGASSLQYAYQLLVIGIPLLCCFFFASRPVRMGLAVMAVLLAQLYFLNDRNRGENLLYAGRSYFGVLKVFEQPEQIDDAEERAQFGGSYRYTYLLHGTTYHGKNYMAEEGKPDLSRLATTYYHRYGPVGIVMEQYNWFSGPQNTYWADARMPATQIGAIVANLGTGALPYASLVDLQSEPPYATVGLGTGSMASYARPFQHLAYYEIDEHIRGFSLPANARQRAYFTYLQGAMKRGAQAETIMGDARLTMQLELARDAFNYKIPAEGADFEPTMGGLYPHREKYYKVMNVDAFSSDAIPVHLVTKESISMYLTKMTDDGVLCMHTSNRHLDLVKPIAKIVDELPDYRAVVGKDGDRGVGTGHFSSEYVMIYRKDNKAFEQFLKTVKNRPSMERSHVEWYDPIRAGQVSSSVWTDDYSNLVSVIRWPWAH